MIAFANRSKAVPCADFRSGWIQTGSVSCLIGLSLIENACGDLARLKEDRYCFRCLLCFWPWVATSDPLLSSWLEGTWQAGCMGWDLGLCVMKKLQSFTCSWSTLVRSVEASDHLIAAWSRRGRYCSKGWRHRGHWCREMSCWCPIESLLLSSLSWACLLTWIVLSEPWLAAAMLQTSSEFSQLAKKGANRCFKSSFSNRAHQTLPCSNFHG